jgi:glycosyltransferase involved in cell wall biosynthesis
VNGGQPVHVALNLVFLVPGEVGGMETYARELIPRLAARQGLRVTCFVNRDAAETGGGPWGEVAPMEVLPVSARNRLEWVRGEQQYVPRLALRRGCDLVHSLASTAPLWGAMPRVTTIHDLNFLKVPDAHFGLRGLGMRVLVPAAARRSTRILVDAASTRDDLSADLGTPADKIDVVPLGVSPPPAVPVEAAARARASLSLPADRPLVLSVSAKRPHKNLERLLQALAAISREHRPLLVVPGYPTEYEAELRRRAVELGVAEHVRWPSWVSQSDLEGLYAAAACLVFPSLYEGFGLPVLEAMARGVPVACSDRSSLPEVAGDAALLFDPEDPAAIARAMTRLLSDRDLRERLGRAGRERASAFTWERTAELTAASYSRALPGRPAA